MSPRRVVVAGASGSIGLQALEVCERERERVRVVGMGVRARWRALLPAISLWQPQGFALEEAGDAARARAEIGQAAPRCRVLEGPGSTERLVAELDHDVCVNGAVGAAGLGISLAALERGVRLALANKESVVIGGPLVRAALERGGELIPVDSEHSAAFQCLRTGRVEDVRRLVLTASGGALRDHPDWRRATPAEVLAHPVWRMGSRITVDSALLLNKGFELIEAHGLFSVPWNQLSVWLHPQASAHALVEFRDGSWVAQAASPDMRLPIQLAMSWPERWGQAVAPLLPSDFSAMRFDEVGEGRFPALDLARRVGMAGGTSPAVLNAADEVAVAAFLDGSITLGELPEILERVVSRHDSRPLESREQLAQVDAWARREAQRCLQRV